MIFLVKRFVPENFQRENFSGPAPTESLRTQDSEHIVGLGDRASFLKLQQLKVRSLEKIGHVKRKIRGVKNQRHSANFRPIALKRIEPGVTTLKSMFYSFQRDGTKIDGVTLIFDTAI